MKKPITEERKRKTVKVGDRSFFIPFRSRIRWVEDNENNTVCECYSPFIAKELAALLNERYKQ